MKLFLFVLNILLFLKEISCQRRSYSSLNIADEGERARQRAARNRFSNAANEQAIGQQRQASRSASMSARSAGGAAAAGGRQNVCPCRPCGGGGCGCRGCGCGCGR